MDNEPHATGQRYVVRVRGRSMRAEREFHHHPDFSLAPSLYLRGGESQSPFLILVPKDSLAEQSHL